MSGLGPLERARLMTVSDKAAFDPDEPHRRVENMVTTAAGAFDAGGADIAENLLWRAAARCFFQDGDARVRAKAAAELERWNPDPDAPHVLTVRAYTEPYRHGPRCSPGSTRLSRTNRTVGSCISSAVAPWSWVI